MRRLLVPVVALAVAVGSAHAQDTAFRDTLMARGADEAAATAIAAAIRQAAAEDLPTELLVGKAYEGLAKGTDGSRIVDAVRQWQQHLGAALTIAAGAGLEDPAPGVLVSAARSIRHRVRRADVRNLLSVAPDDATRAAGLDAVTALAVNGFDADDAAKVVLEMLQDGYQRDALLEIPSYAVTLLGAGVSRSEIIARLLAGEGF